MANLNKIQLIGNLTRDPELRHTPKGTAVAEISIAINRAWVDASGTKQEETTFVEITFWGKTAEIAQKYLSKGRGVYIEGRLQLDTWDDKDTGKKRSKLKVIGENLQFLPDGRGGERSASTPAPHPAGQQASRPPAAAAAPQDSFMEEDDIPF